MSVARIKRLLLMPLIGLIFTISTLATPFFAPSAYAVPTGNNTATDVINNTTRTTGEDSSSSLNEGHTDDDSGSSLDEGRTERGSASPSADESVATDSSDAVRDETTTESSSDTSCIDQVGTIGWLVCPATGFLANTIDALYSAIEGLLVVEPLSSDTDSPIFVVWNYARNISNIVFVILLLIVVFSQITGLGLSNYGIKRTLPRIIVAAILVNLSFIIASIAVDISNIFGLSLRNFLANVGETAITSGAVNPEVNFSVTDLFAAIAGGGAILGISVAAAGGFSALLALLIPVIIGCVISVAAGLLTISLRQAVVALLIMISPLAFVAYLLPNTEKYFNKWLKIFMQMIIFYPMFSLLFGASRLAGWILITSAENGLGVILGVAVQIFPLFMGISLMKMSGTILGSVGGFLAGVGIRASNASRSYAGSLRDLKRAQYLSTANRPKKFDIPRRAAQRLNDRRIDRIRRTAALQDDIQKRGEAYSATHRYNYNGTNLSRSGREHHAILNNSENYNRTILSTNNDFNQGISEVIAANRARHSSSNPISERRFQQTVDMDSSLSRASDRLKYQQARTVDINLQNLQGYADRTNEAITTKMRTGVENIQYKDIESSAGIRGQEGINTVFANALSARTRVRNEVTSDYVTLFQDTPLTAEIDDYLERALRDKDENIMAAAIQVMMQRGDTDLVAKKLADNTPHFSGNSPEDLAMQKRLSDALLPYKKDSVTLWAYAKNLNMARGKAENARRNGEPINPSFFNFEDFLNPNGEAASWGLDIDTMIATADESVLGSQDRTFYNYAKELGRLFGTETQRRNVLFGGVQVTGERLSSAIDMHLGKNAKWGSNIPGYESPKAARKVLTFTDQAALDEARTNITSIIKGNNASHFAKFKGAELDAFTTIMSDDNLVHRPDGSIVIDIRDKDHRNEMVARGLEALIQNGAIDRNKISDDLHRLYIRGGLNGMNPETRAILDSVLHFQ